MCLFSISVRVSAVRRSPSLLLLHTCTLLLQQDLRRNLPFSVSGLELQAKRGKNSVGLKHLLFAHQKYEIAGSIHQEQQRRARNSCQLRDWAVGGVPIGQPLLCSLGPYLQSHGWQMSVLWLVDKSLPCYRLCSFRCCPKNRLCWLGSWKWTARLL